MKNAFLLLALLAFPFVLKAQNDASIRIKIDSFVRGGDSVRYTIRGLDDTIQVTKLFRSGRIRQIDWETDSSYSYNVLGHFERITYKPNEDTTTYIDFYSNGTIFTKGTRSSLGYTEVEFERNGQIRDIEQRIDLDTKTLFKKTDKNGRIIHVYTDYILGKTTDNRDSFRRYDTLFYTNGQIKKIEITDNNSVSYGKKYFKKDGTFLKEEAAINEKFFIFKDNLDCFYGLKNAKGDTILRPRYEHIQAIVEGYLWEVHEGDKTSLLQLNGKSFKLFATHFSYAGLIERININSDKIDSVSNSDEDNIYESSFFSYRDDGKQGVIDDSVNIVLPPQSFDIGRKCIGNGKYFSFSKSTEDGSRKGYLDRTGKPLFDKQFNNVFTAYHADYFFLNNDKSLSYKYSNEDGEYRYGGGYINFDEFEDASEARFGLGKADGTVLLKPKFCAIYTIPNTTLFVVATEIKSEAKALKEDIDLGIETDGKVTKTVNHGIFDARTRSWVIPPKGFLVSNLSLFRSSEAVHLEIKDIKRGKYGTMDFEGKLLIPIEYDGIEGNRVIKDGKYQKFRFENDKIVFSPNKYDFIQAFGYHNDGRSGTDTYYFVAQKDGKWGVIDEEEKIIKPFEFDYASVYGGYEGNILLVKNNQAYAFDFESLPNERLSYHHIGEHSTPEELGEYPIVDDPSHIIFINNTGKVVIPPQYKVLQEGGNFMILEDDKKQRKLLNMLTSQISDFPFDYEIVDFRPIRHSIIVKDVKTSSFGVVSKDGKVIIPCDYGSISISDEDSTIIFAQKKSVNTPVKKDDNDYSNYILGNTTTLKPTDFNWQLFDVNGKLLTPKSFDYPINFFKGVGVGMQDSVFNLYQNKGTIIRPFRKNTEGVTIIDKSIRFKSIRYLSSERYLAFFYQQGLNTAMIVTKTDGEIIVEAGQYNGISPFYDGYAMVYNEGKLGWIDTLGKEIIAPQDMRTYDKHFIDSIQNLVKTILIIHSYTGDTLEAPSIKSRLPIQFSAHFGAEGTIKSSDTTMTPFQRASVWNILLEKCPNIINIENVRISRGEIFANVGFIYNNLDSHSDVNVISVTNKTLSIVYEKGSLNVFKNLYYQNGRWQDIKLKDLLFLQGEKHQQLNNIVAQKIKNLQDAFIDCSDPSNFLKQVEDKWLMTKEGVSLYFDSYENYSKKSKIVSLTWAELSPFLKIKITDK